MAIKIESLFKRLFGRYKLSIIIQDTRLSSIRKMLISNVAIADSEQRIIASVESIVCKIAFWQSIKGCWLAGELKIKNLHTNWEIVAKENFDLYEIIISFGINRKKATIIAESNGITFVLQKMRKKEETKTFSEVTINWDAFISVMGDHLIFGHLKKFCSTSPVEINSILSYSNKDHQFYFNGFIKADHFALQPVKNCESPIIPIDKSFLLSTLLSKFGGSHINEDDYIPYNEIPEQLINAVICTEDPCFWTHKGLAPSFIGYALAANMQSGRFERGASTITMQLVRNLFLHHHKTLVRKVEECVIALLLENYFKIEKKDILEIYLNLIEFAPDVYGLQRGCLFYFGKSCKDLSLCECLVLTYIIPRPKHFYEALLSKSEQLTRNLKSHIQYYANVMLHKEMVSSDRCNHAVNAIEFSSQFGTLIL